MGARKHIAAEKLKEARKNLYFAKLVGVPSSPRKMRYVVDMIRGMEVNRALGVLRFSKKQASADVENYSVQLSLTGKLRIIARLKTVSFISVRSSLTKALQ